MSSTPTARPTPRLTPRLARRLAVLVTALALVGSAGCGADGADGDSAGSAADGGDATNAAATDAFPVTVENCGSEVTVERRPERVVVVDNDPVANLEALGAVDRVVGTTAELAPDLYDDATYAALGDLDVLSTDTTSTGGSIVSQEALLATDPDLVLAPESAVDRDALAAAGVAVYSPTAYCDDPGPELSQRATFDRVWSEVRDYGRLLGESERAEDVVARGEAEVAATPAAADAGTAAAVYVSSGGSVLSPYGAPSMVTPVFDAVGLDNVYADVDERVFDVTAEDLLERDPGTIVLLYSGDDPQATVDSFLAAPGVDGLTAVREDRVVTLPFSFTDPPSMLSVRGPAALAEQLAGLS